MPGKLISIPFLSQNEDMDRYLIEYQRHRLNNSNNKGKMRSNQQRQDNNKNNHGQMIVDNTGFIKNRSQNNNNIGNNRGNFSNHMKNGNGGVPITNYYNQQKVRYSQQQLNQPMATAQMKQVYSQFYYSLNNKLDNAAPLSDVQSQQPFSNQQDMATNFQSFNKGGYRQNEYVELFKSSFAGMQGSATPSDYTKPATTSSQFDYMSGDNFTGQLPSMGKPATSSYLDDYLMPKMNKETRGSIDDISLEISKDISNLSLGVDSNVGLSSFPFTDNQHPLVSSSLAYDLDSKSTANSTLDQNSNLPFNIQSTRGSLVDSMSPLLKGSASLNWENNDLPSSSTSGNRLGIWNNDMSVWS